MNKVYLNKEDCRNFLNYQLWFCEKKEEIGLFETKEKYIVIRKTGNCDYKICKNACCKICSAGYVKDYSRGFFDKVDEFGKDVLIKKCNNLQKDHTCKLWGKRSTKDSSTNKGFPLACNQFPPPSDSIYWNVIDVCSLKFEILWKLKKFNSSEKYIKEMIKNFKEII